MIAALLCVAAAGPLHAKNAVQPVVAMTFDDLPHTPAGVAAAPVTPAVAARSNRKILAALRRFHAPATGFVVETRIAALGPGADQLLTGWNRGLYELANHSFSHADANKLTVTEIEQEIVKGEGTIGPMAREAGRRLNFFRFPFNHLGETKEKQAAALSFLKSRGYQLAAATIDTSDYAYDAAFGRALRERDGRMQRLIKRAYLDHTAKQIAYYAGLNRHVLGFEPPAIMLLHVNQLNAETLPDQLRLFRKMGYRFVTLAEAQSHAVYAEPPQMATLAGPMWAYRWARDRRVKYDGSLEEEPPSWLLDYGAGKAVQPPKE